MRRLLRRRPRRALGKLAVEAEGGGVESLTHTAPGGGLLSTGILPMLTAPNHARGLAQVIQTQDEMTGILLDMTAYPVVRVRRLTLLIIPEEGGRTCEFKIPRMLAWFAAFSCVVVLVLLVAGFIAHSDAQDLRRLVARLEREKGVLEEDVGLLTELEGILKDLEERNNQLRQILSGPEAAGVSSSPSNRGAKMEHYVSAVDRLLGGQVRTVPTLWPVRGVPLGRFSPAEGGIVVAAPAGSLVRASAAGTVLRAGFDLQLGYAVVLDHGNRLITEYGYNNTLLVEAGEFVQKGQPVALSGRGGDPNNTGLFFSVYENGKPRNPLAYRIWL